ncbi:mandelate racemase/muconate lactonizing enzyme family protein [Microbacterium sp. BK668]|uniref:mandelate racemase/muconate lactonizing enzyme family protein n=1 Tax=Microbacterium sp. BK668 TaxID=2512118 RepID=UPI001060FA14|nr:mandelate racemase/muconate lactonizing enzyme family protein [Microbacterium sp. BK668]TDN91550.1 galactonate dehydratase [Microbacterium sp. BK668]
MKIDRIRTLTVGAPTPGTGRLTDRNYLFVIVETKDGITGIGEATLEGHDHAVRGLIEDLAPLAIGQDARRISYVTQKLRRQKFWGGGVVKGSAIAGIELALWDILGKAAGRPVHELLGGAVRDRIRVYANGWSGGATDPVQVADLALRAYERGYRAFKFSVALPIDPVRDAVGVRTIVGVGEAIRAAVGPDCPIMLDGHGRYDAHLAIELARALEPVDLLFFEEPVQPHRPDDMRRVSEAAPMPIAAGERLTTKEETLPFLANGALAVVQPDLAHCHGLAEARDISVTADLFGAWVAPHSPMSPLVTVASLHLDAVAPNFLIQERLFLDDWRDDIIDRPLVVTDGYLPVPAGPGWGVDLDWALCESKPEITVEMPQLVRSDGSVADW